MQTSAHTPRPPQVLRVVMYHYVRDLPNTPFPRIKGMLLDDFRTQVNDLKSRYEMATLESALAYLNGTYAPNRDMCLLTFDDGLKEHFREVTPILADAHVQGVFFLITGCLEDQTVAPVHMNHFLMASLDFDSYRRAFLERLRDLDAEAPDPAAVPAATAARIYPWDTADIAAFKWYFNFRLDSSLRDEVVSLLFREHLGAENAFSRDLYLNWAEAREMRLANMALGGHSHRHRPLSGMPEVEMDWDLSMCRRLLDHHLGPQQYLPFCYPYGKHDSFNSHTVSMLKQLSFACGFSTESGDNQPGAQLFSISRIDCKRAGERHSALGGAQ